MTAAFWILLTIVKPIVSEFSLLLESNQVKLYDFTTNRRIIVNFNTTILGKDLFTDHIKHILGLNISHLNNIPDLNDLDKANIISNLNYFELSAKKIENNFDLIDKLPHNNSKSLSGDCITHYWTVQNPIIELVTATASLAKLKLAQIRDKQTYNELDLLFNDLRTELTTVLHNTTNFLNLANALMNNKKNIDILNYVQNSECIPLDKKFFIVFSICNSPAKNLQCLINAQIIQHNGNAKRLIAVPHNNRSLCYKNLFRVAELFKTAQCLPPGLSCPLIPVPEIEQTCLQNIWNNFSSPIDHCRVCDSKRPIIQTNLGSIVQAEAYFKLSGNSSALQNQTFKIKSASGEFYEFNISQTLKLNLTTLIKSALAYTIILRNLTINFAPNSNENLLVESMISNYQLHQLKLYDNVDEIAMIVLNWDKYAIPSGLTLALIVFVLGIKAGTDFCREKTRIRRLRKKQNRSRSEDMNRPSDNLLSFLEK